MTTEHGVSVTGVRHLRGGGPLGTISTDSKMHLLVWPDRGGLTVRLADSWITARSPLGLWLPAGLEAALGADDVIRVATFDASTCPDAWRRIERLDMSRGLSGVLMTLADQTDRPWAPALASAAVERLATDLARLDVEVRLPTHDAARAVADRLVADPSIAWDLAQWSELVPASVRTLRRAFRDETGTPFRRWRLRLRMQRAMALLDDGQRIADVAAAVGYGSSEAFMRVFKGEIGMTATQFVERHDVMAAARERSWPLPSVDGPNRSVEPASVSLAAQPHQREPGDDMTDRQTDRRTFLAGAALAGAGWALAACGSDDSSGDDGEASSGSGSSAESASSPAAATEATTTMSIDESTITGDPRIIVADEETFGLVLDLGIIPIAAGGPGFGFFGEDAPGGGNFHPSTALRGAGDVESFADGEPNLERIAELEPDAVVGPQWIAEEPVWSPLPEGVDMILIETDPVADAAGFVAEAGEKLGAPEPAAAAIAEFDARVDALAGAPSTDRLSLDFVRPRGDTFDIYVGGFGLEQMAEIGYSLPARDPESGVEADRPDFRATALSFERLDLLRADVIVIVRYQGEFDEEGIALLTSSPLWETLPAVQADRVIEVDSTIVWMEGGLAGTATEIERLVETLDELE
ncbi:MAG: AraC family transcriptional regulator [Actinomycetota bacterium]